MFFLFLCFFSCKKKGFNFSYGKKEIDDNELQNENALLVVDCLGSLISPLLGKHASGFVLMNEMARKLKLMAINYNMAVVVTNYTVDDGNKPALGKQWTYIADTTLFLSYNDTSGEGEGKRTMVLFKTNKTDTKVRDFKILQSLENVEGNYLNDRLLLRLHLFHTRLEEVLLYFENVQESFCRKRVCSVYENHFLSVYASHFERHV